jgi:ATP-dependent RNA helicase DDX3X
MSEGNAHGRKAIRRAKQSAAMDERSEREDAHFLAERRKALITGGAERAPTAAQQAEAQRELFAGHIGAAGINFREYTQILVTRSGHDAENPPAIAGFHTVKASLPGFLGRNLGLLGYEAPTPIQQHAIPLALAGRDLMCCAQTGSGKTCAFLLPIVAMLNPDGPEQMKPDSVSPQAVVLAPTRELAQQIEVEAQKLLHSSGRRSACVYGGAKPNAQLSELAKGVTLLVATPGRLQDFADRGIVTLASIRFLVLDEADRMLDMGFEPQIRRIVERSGMPAKAARQTLMFSATFPPEMQKLAADFLRSYVWIGVGRVGSTTKNIEQRIVRAENSKQLKMPLLVAALAAVNGRTLVFVKKKATATWVAKQLRRSPIDGGSGIDSAEIHGDRSQSQRELALARFKEGSVRVLVATDVAARGLDIDQVAHVINFDLGSTKDDFDSYVHRIGRTGRAGHTGIATSFYTPGFDPKTGCGAIARDLVKFMQETGQQIPDWLLALPELAGVASGGGDAASGFKKNKDAGHRDARDVQQPAPRPSSARFDRGSGPSIHATARSGFLQPHVPQPGYVPAARPSSASSVEKKSADHPQAGARHVILQHMLSVRCDGSSRDESDDHPTHNFHVPAVRQGAIDDQNLVRQSNARREYDDHPTHGLHRGGSAGRRGGDGQGRGGGVAEDQVFYRGLERGREQPEVRGLARGRGRGSVGVSGTGVGDAFRCESHSCGDGRRVGRGGWTGAQGAAGSN